MRELDLPMLCLFKGTMIMWLSKYDMDDWIAQNETDVNK